jgi:hypothetical protein
VYIVARRIRITNVAEFFGSFLAVPVLRSVEFDVPFVLPMATGLA